MSYLLRISQNFNSTALTSSELAYYARQILLPSIGTIGQRKLKVARVLVVGAGGLGCPILQSLAGAGVGHISIIDGDDISTSNLSRQWLYSHKDKGKNKAVSATERLKEINTFIEFKALPLMLDQENAFELIKSHDLVIDASDTLEARYLIDDACTELNCPWVHAAIYRERAQFSVFWARYGASFRLLYPNPSMAPSCSETGILGAFASLIGNMQALETIKLITGNAIPKVGQLISFDSEKHDLHIFTIPKAVPPKLYGDGADCNTEFAVSVEALEKLIMSTEQFVILDIRDNKEFDNNSIKGAISYPAEYILGNGYDTAIKGNILLVCEEGLISSMLAKAMNQQSRKFYYLEGGLKAWRDQNSC